MKPFSEIQILRKLLFFYYRHRGNKEKGKSKKHHMKCYQENFMGFENKNRENTANKTNYKMKI
jgi:hypothetical protein